MHPPPCRRSHLVDSLPAAKKWTNDDIFLTATLQPQPRVGGTGRLRKRQAQALAAARGCLAFLIERSLVVELQLQMFSLMRCTHVIVKGSAPFCIGLLYLFFLLLIVFVLVAECYS